MTVPNQPRAVLRVSGDDAVAFLQGQLCSDVHQLAPERGQLSALNTPKGRVIAVFRMVLDGAAVLMSLPAERVDEVVTTLRRYVLRSKVTIDADADGLTAVACCRLPKALPEPAAPFAATQGDGCVALRLPGEPAVFELYGPTAALSGAYSDADHDDAAAAVVEAGVPDVFEATAGAFVAQMLNLDQLDGISFKKGCYTGQEVIARTQHLGRVKRRMLRYAAPAGEVRPAPGDKVVHADSGATLGTVVQAAPRRPQGLGLLAVMRLEAAARAPLALSDGTPLTALDDPA